MLDIAKEGEPLWKKLLWGLPVICHGKFPQFRVWFSAILTPKLNKNDDLHSTLKSSSFKYISERETQSGDLEGLIRNCRLQLH